MEAGNKRREASATLQNKAFPSPELRRACSSFPACAKINRLLSQDGATFDRAYIVRGEPTQRRYEGQHKLDGWQYPNAVVWKDDLYVAYSINKEDVAITQIALKDLAAGP